MAFSGWPVEALEFFEGLEVDNSRAYWTAHRAGYDQQVHAPMVDLLADLEPRFGPGRIYRPYRDVRFSRDKRTAGWTRQVRWAGQVSRVRAPGTQVSVSGSAAMRSPSA